MVLKYKGYIGAVDFDENADTFYGRVINTDTVIHFAGESATELKQSFHDGIDDYLDDCREKGVEPQKPYSGNLPLRVHPRYHKYLAARSSVKNVSMNKYVMHLIKRDMRRHKEYA